MCNIECLWDERISQTNGVLRRLVQICAISPPTTVVELRAHVELDTHDTFKVQDCYKTQPPCIEQDVDLEEGGSVSVKAIGDDAIVQPLLLNTCDDNKCAPRGRFDQDTSPPRTHTDFEIEGPAQSCGRPCQKAKSIKATLNVAIEMATEDSDLFNANLSLSSMDAELQCESNYSSM
ncbi:unnamed protein product [Phytophthora fragariaefolia]|uniref:Unnamed protein product n=1 Tax=Phytophthora fragariaefolia TaxID=1490495 RepID=A0A9W6TNH0_9STRA|nr:unnamed protein product [Phytophthora fragariaefolia]